MRRSDDVDNGKHHVVRCGALRKGGRHMSFHVTSLLKRGLSHIKVLRLVFRVEQFAFRAVPACHTPQQRWGRAHMREGTLERNNFTDCHAERRQWRTQG
jgi:hypothetical protein